MPREKKVPEEDEGIDESWLASWADGMTLLMAFFVMLYAFALVDETKFAEFKVGMTMALGVADPVDAAAPSLMDSGNGIALTVGQQAIPSKDVEQLVNNVERALEESGGTVTPENAEAVKELLEERFRAVGAAESVSVELDQRGVVIRFPDRMLFDSGQATFDNDVAPIVLGQTSQVLNTLDNLIDIEGHTDDVPTGRSWPSNWELSGARASAVVRWFHQFGRVPDVRMAAIGLADTRPRETNDTPEGRAVNRRVEVVILVDGVIDSELDAIRAFDGAAIETGLPAPADGDAATGSGSDGTDSGATAAEADGVTAAPDGQIASPVEIDPIRTGLES